MRWVCGWTGRSRRRGADHERGREVRAGLPATVWTPAKDGDTPGQRDIEDDPPQPIMAGVPVAPAEPGVDGER